MGHRKSKWVVARKQGKRPVIVVAGTHYRLKKTAQKKARQLNKAYDGTNIKFVVRKEGWNTPRRWS